MKLVTALLVFAAVSVASAADKMKMNFTNEELTKIIEAYSKASGQKFVVDPGVRGKVTIFLPETVTTEEAFNHLSSALAINGFAISKQGDTMVVKAARNIQRDLIEVSTEKPTVKPERMYTWVYTAKHTSSMVLNTNLRILASKDGEIQAVENTNQLIITDWSSNLNRIAELLKEVDKPVDAATAKIVDATRKEREARNKNQATTKPEEKKAKTEN
ncbi:secretin N-terminal domain-containing protein [Bdellovibrio sp. HCB337]|uniref:secretin N-terminal domain-containing protein n=1 Tax=Bdellovibrio sp. HCB337 TaxID=3394358 RepID=UPI0039A6C89D